MRTLSDGRQRRSRKEWQEIISRFERSGLSENGFCGKHRLNRKTFRAWRQRLVRKQAVPPAFVELAMPEPAEEPTPVTLEAGTFEIQLPGGVLLRWKP